MPDEVQTQTEPSQATQTGQNQPAGQPETVAAQAGDSTDFLQTQTLEEIKRLPEDHALHQMYKQMQRDYTQKTMALADERKKATSEQQSFDQWKPVITALQQDPKQAIRAMAVQVGLNLTDNGQQAANQPDELSQLAEAAGDTDGALVNLISRVVQKTLEPVQSQLATLHNDYQVSQFGSKVPTWKEREQEMTQLTQKVLPASGKPNQEYLEVIYKAADYDRLKASIEQQVADGIKRELDKINGVPANTDSPQTGASETQVSEVMPKGLSFAQKAIHALKKAKEGKAITGFQQ